MAFQNPNRVVFIANCVHGEHVAGGDIHFFNMAQAAVEAGYSVHFLGGKALKKHLEGMRSVNHGIRGTITVTDKGILGPVGSSLRDQFRLLRDYWGRFRGTMRKLDEIREEDIVHAVTDYWFDAWPAIWSRARR